MTNPAYKRFPVGTRVIHTMPHVMLRGTVIELPEEANSLPAYYREQCVAVKLDKSTRYTASGGVVFWEPQHLEALHELTTAELETIQEGIVRGDGEALLAARNVVDGYLHPLVEHKVVVTIQVPKDSPFSDAARVVKSCLSGNDLTLGYEFDVKEES